MHRPCRGVLALLVMSGLAGCVDDGPDASASEAPLVVADGGVPRGASWRYWDRGGDLGTAWRTGGFDDTGWALARGPLGYGETYVTPIGYGPDPAHKYVTSYFRTQFTLDDPASVTGLVAELMYDDGAVIYLNGREVVRRSMPSGTITATTLAAGHETGNQYERIELGAHRDALVAGVNTIAVEVHQASASSSDLTFDLALDVQVAPTGDLPRRSTWSYWDGGGDLGTAWRQPGYDDRGWARGAGVLGFGETYVSTVVRPGPITHYFRAEVSIDDPARVRALFGEVMYDDGFVVYLNGTEVGRAAMPAGAVTASTRSSGHEAGNVYTTYDWSAARGLLVAGVNTIAVEVHQVSAGSSDLVFDLALNVVTEAPPGDDGGVARGARWAYWDRGGDLGSAWRALGYDDAAWARGAGPLGYGEPYLATTVGYGPDPADKHPTTYFRKRFTLDLPAGERVTDLAAEVMYDDGAVIYLNGTEVARLAMPAGPVTAGTRSTGHEASNAYQRVDLSAYADLLVDGDNLVAVEVHQLDAGSSDLVFDLALEVARAPVFTRHPDNPVIAAGDPDAGGYWRQYVSGPQVVKLGPGAWVMYFTGNDGDSRHSQVGRATSSDGIHWTLAERVVNGRAHAVLHDGAQYAMLLDDPYGSGVELLTSADGVTWTERGVVHPEALELAVVRVDGVYRMYWTDGSGALRYSSSRDLLAWSLHGQVATVPAYTTGLAVIHDGGVYELWYGDETRFGYATSVDGRAWTMRGTSLRVGPIGSWDEYRLLRPFVMRDEGQLKLWYTGAGLGDPSQIGYATSP